VKTRQALYCRTFQTMLKAGSHLMPWRQPILLDGENAVRRLPALIAGQGCQNLLIVTGPHICSSGLLDPLLSGLDQGKIRYTVFSNLQANPTIENVENAVASYHKNHCDSLLAVGGGSPMDCAKACGARIARPAKTVSQLKGLFKVMHRLPPFFAVPTTAGTGSETTVAAVIMDGRTHHKYAINDISLVPGWAVLDPVLTVGLPPFITATTGMDVLTHAVEAYIGRSNTAKTKKWAIEATRLVFENLEECHRNGANLVARDNMLKASYLAGAAFTRAYVGYVHAIAHTIGGFYGVPHGLANAVILPKMLERYGESVHRSLAELAEAAGVSSSAPAFIDAIKQMNRRMEIPGAFTQIKKEDIPQMAAYTDKEGNPLYPVPLLLDKEELAEVIAGLMERTR